MIAGALACQSCNATLAPGLTTCPQCGAPVTSPGTPVPAVTDWAADRRAWNALLQRLPEVTGGEYEVLAELGHGGMAAVYLAWHHALHKHVALKVMSPAVMLTKGMTERFRAEAVTQARLEHAHIATVHGVRQDGDLHYIVMQYVPGRTLAQVLRNENAAGRKLSIPVVRSLLCHVGSALAHAHREGVIHRDVKPGNMILRGNGDAVVTDFGIAKVLSDPSITMTGAVVGTAPYMSPEQCYAADLTAAADQYSLGIVAYELLTGAPPFTGKSFAVMQAHVSETPAPISAQRPDCPEEVEAAVMRMLAKQAEDRFPDINTALDALKAAGAPAPPDDPVRRELIRLADVDGVRAELGDIVRGPLSPMPPGMKTARAGTQTPVSPLPATRAGNPTPVSPKPASRAGTPTPASPVSAAAVSPAAAGSRPDVVEPVPAPAPTNSRSTLVLGAAGLVVAGALIGFLVTRNSGENQQLLNADSKDSIRVVATDAAPPPPQGTATTAPNNVRATAEPAARSAPVQNTTAPPPPRVEDTVAVATKAPEPPLPTSGTLRIGGDLPAGTTITLRDQGGQTRTLTDRTLTLDPGSYVVEFRAPGFAPDQGTIRIRVGETESWSPSVRALPAPVVAPARDTAAEASATLAAMRRFVDAFNARNVGDVIPLLPADKREAWRTLFQTQGVSGYSATLTGNEPVRFVDTDATTVPFSIRVRFRLMNQNQDQLLHFVGALQRSTGVFRIISLQ